MFYNNHLNFSILGPMKTISKILVIKIAENKLIKIPKDKVRANPFMKDVENINRIAQTIKEFKLLSRIDGQAREKPSEIAKVKPLPCLISSFILAKIKMLASTAIPMDKINPPIPAKVKVTGINLNTASTIAT